jgi:Flp pilus assembly protein CpaB
MELGALKFLRRQPFGVSLLLSALVGVAIAAEVSGWHETQRISDPRYLVAKRDLHTGEALGLTDFGLATRGALGGQVPPGSITDQDLELVRGAWLESDLTEGEVLTLSALRSPSQRLSRGAIPAGFLAYPLRAESSLPVLKGDQVDLILRPDLREESPETLVENARILTVERSAEPGEAPTLILALRQEDVELVEKAQQRGKLRLALRSPKDASRGSRHKRRRTSARRSHSRIEILTEGE